MRTARKKRSGFTLVELLVVIAIIAMLVTLLLPAVQAAREAARKTQCSNHLKQIGLGLSNFESARQIYPFGADDDDCEVRRDRNPITWRVSILPFVEQQAIYDELTEVAAQSVVRGCYPVREWENSPLQRAVMDGYICPSESGGPIKEGFFKLVRSQPCGNFFLLWKCRTRFHRATGLGHAEYLRKVHGWFHTGFVLPLFDGWPSTWLLPWPEGSRTRNVRHVPQRVKPAAHS